MSPRRVAAGLVAAGAVMTLGFGAGLWWVWQTLTRPFGEPGNEIRLEVPAGGDARSILRRLEAAGVLADADLARLYLIYVLDDPALKAGDYQFALPLTTPEVLAKLQRGEVETERVTVVEGLSLEEIATALAAGGFGRRDAFVEAMSAPEPIADLDPAASTLEGYLFPDTYAFARGTSEVTIVGTMVETFRRRFAAEIAPLRPAEDVRALVTLASIVEKEAQLDAERALIAGVYANRLRIGMALYADPTIIYALRRLGNWDGNLRRRDLKLDSPYNTYVYPGLPPGPICSPGLASLRAAATPATGDYLYFVSRNDGSHVFAATLTEHNRNVQRWQKDYWRERWRQEGRQPEGKKGGG